MVKIKKWSAIFTLIFGVSSTVALAQTISSTVRGLVNQKVLACESKIKGQLKSGEVKFFAIGHAEVDPYIENANKFNKNSQLEREYQVSTSPTHKVLKLTLANYRFVDNKKFESFAADIELSPDTPKWPLSVQLEANLLEGNSTTVTIAQTINFSTTCEGRAVETSVQKVTVDGQNLTAQNWEHASEKTQIEFKEVKATLPTDRAYDISLLPALGGARVIQYYEHLIGQKLVSFGSADIPLMNFRIEHAEPVEVQNPLTKATEKLSTVKLVWSDEKQSLSEYRLLFSPNSPYGERIQSTGVHESVVDEATWGERVLTGSADGMSLVKFDKTTFDGRTVLRADLQTNQDFTYPNIGAYWQVEAHEPISNPKREDLTFDYTIKARKKAASRDSLLLSNTVTATPEFLRSSLYVESNHPKIQALAQELTRDFKGTRLEMAQKIASLVNKLIVFDDDMMDENTITPLKASQILERGGGVCQHFAILYAAIARATGLPARVISGYALEARQSFGHAWNEVEIQDGVWLPLEPQFKNLFSMKYWQYLPLAVSAEMDDPTRKSDLVKEQWMLANFIFSIRSL